MNKTAEALWWWFLSEKVHVGMCEVGVTNAEPSEHNSILAVKVTQITKAREGLTECNLLQYIVHPSHLACQSL